MVGDCFQSIAVEKNDENICARIKDTFSGPRCFVLLAKQKVDVSICDKIEGRDSHVSDCIQGVAEQKNDESLCAQIEKSTYSDSCYASLASLKQDASICASIEQERKRNSCYENLEASPEALAEEEQAEEEGDEKYGIIEKDGKVYIKSKPGEVLSISSSDLPDWANAQMVVVGASAVCVGPPSTISSGDSNVLLNGLPVARKGDETSHGGSITEGSDKIFINGVPAAFVGAQTVCPMVSPGPVPHVGGPISNNGY
ncbi:hypothetical protein C0583_00325 [Candidatus Parcubacteria bacterium]|nr:MAG: hypothetical protein C0583_00325 [Candidatus Parcubacteria bacterium]